MINHLDYSATLCTELIWTHCSPHHSTPCIFLTDVSSCAIKWSPLLKQTYIFFLLIARHSHTAFNPQQLFCVCWRDACVHTHFTIPTLQIFPQSINSSCKLTWVAISPDTNHILPFMQHYAICSHYRQVCMYIWWRLMILSQHGWDGHISKGNQMKYNCHFI